MTDREEEVRFVALETKIAYQEKLLDDLNRVLIEQSNTLVELAKRLHAVEEAFRGAFVENKPGHERPPHY